MPINNTENQETSADIVQDSFAKLWQIREDFFYLHQVKAFLYTAVRNKALNELEHSKVVYEYAQNVIEKKRIPFFTMQSLKRKLIVSFLKP